MVDAMETDTVRKTLARRYSTMVAPAAVLFGGWAAARHAGLVHDLDQQYTDIIGPVVFIAAILMAVALPLLYRIRFVKGATGNDNVSLDAFVPFQLNSMTLALIAPYAAAIGYMAGVSNFHFSGAFLAALYAGYYYFPSQKRVAREMKLFRVK